MFLLNFSYSETTEDERNLHVTLTFLLLKLNEL
jgi:hypothetical protein